MAKKIINANKAKPVFSAGEIFFLLFSIIFMIGCNPQGPSTLQPGTAAVNELAPEAGRIIQLALSDDDPRIRANAIEVVADTGQIRFAPDLERLLNDQWVPVRFSAALGIGDLRYEAAKNSVETRLNDPDENVRIAAAYAMSRLGRPQSLDIVKDAINNKNQTVRANAVVLLGKSGDRDSMDLLYRVLRDPDSDYKVRFQALEAIARLGDEEVYRKLWTMLLSVYADDRAMGIRAMGALGTRKARDILITKLDDDVLEVRLAAAEQLGTLGDKTGEKEVLDVFEKNLTAGMEKDGIERVNILIALAIGRIGTDSLRKYLPVLLKNESKYVRIATAKAVFLLTGSK